MEPASSIIKNLGGLNKVAQMTGAHVSRVYRWRCSKDKGGTDGRIPAKHIPVLLEHAQSSGIKLSAGDFYPTSLPSCCSD